MVISIERFVIGGGGLATPRLVGRERERRGHWQGLAHAGRDACGERAPPAKMHSEKRSSIKSSASRDGFGFMVGKSAESKRRTADWQNRSRDDRANCRRRATSVLSRFQPTRGISIHPPRQSSRWRRWSADRRGENPFSRLSYRRQSAALANARGR